MKRENGFTLIEISMVLVIIGLLLGGVLKGQEMMTNARIKRLSQDLNGVSAAMYAYLDRYGALPGDDPRAAARWGGTASSETAGNGVIEGDFDSTSETDESRLLWEHLRHAGLISGSGNSLPSHAFGGHMGVENSRNGINGHVICMDAVEGKIAEIIDVQLDDASNESGDIQGDPDGAYALDSSYILCRKI